MRRPSAPHMQRVTDVPPMERVMGFYCPNEIDLALGSMSFDVAEEIQLTIAHARHDDPKVSLAGLKHMRNLRNDMMRANGLIGTVSETQRRVDPDGNRTEVTVSTSILGRLQQERARDPGADHDEHRLERHRAYNATLESLDDSPGHDSPGGSHGEPGAHGDGPAAEAPGDGDLRPGTDVPH